jgi:hypothetical protein
MLIHYYIVDKKTEPIYSSATYSKFLNGHFARIFKQCPVVRVQKGAEIDSLLVSRLNF